MALRSAAHGLISAAKTWPQVRVVALCWAAFLALAVAGPWLAPGYIFGTDWPGPRHFQLLTELSSSAPLRVALAAIGCLLSGELTGKLLYLGVLFAAALLAFLATPTQKLIAKLAAAMIFVANPFVFGRLHYGQLFLLGAYALLPWTVIRLRELLDNPHLRSALLVAVSFALVGMMSPHVFLMAWLVAAVQVVTHAFALRNMPSYRKRLGTWTAVAAGATLAASAYWIVPLFAGRGYEGGVIARTGRGELSAYAAVPDRSLGLIPNLLGLFGFWAENAGRFASMKAFVPMWPAVLAAVLLVAAIGAATTVRRRAELAPWVVGLVLTAALALILETGVSNPATSGLVRWLDANVAPYRGMRDAGKWAALLALVYSQLLGLGVAAILGWIRTWRPSPNRAEWVGAVAAGLLLALPLYYGNGLLFGAHGEIKPSAYPAGWYAADRALLADAHPERTLFLPWHEYMSLSFVNNQNNVVASPAPTFFSVPILASANPEVPGISPPVDPEQNAVSQLVKEGAQTPWAQVLASLHVKYVLLARELDWSNLAYLGSQPDMTQVGDYGSILLFRNTLVN